MSVDKEMLAFDQIDLTLPGLRGHYQRGDFTPRQLVTLLRERSAQYSDRNIWIHALTDAELEPHLQRLEQADKALPLYGVPFAIKDNIDLAGVPTTAACPAFEYTPGESAVVVQLLLDAGAIPLGKTNLDQFATGLVGVRSPYGECRNSFDPAYISGGSSAGSAVSVALGLVTFSLGTDTAGSGRVPAALNNLVGLKPTLGALSTRGVVPACRSLDCVSLFALTASDVSELFAIAAQFDPRDPYSRTNPSTNRGTAFGALPTTPFRFGVPRADQLEFFGDDDSAALFAACIEQLRALGGEAVEIDFQPFTSAATLLYEGPWVTERYLVAGDLMERQPDAVLPVIHQVVGKGRNRSAAETFTAQYEMKRFRRIAEQTLAGLDFIVTPTAGTPFTREQLREEPVLRNSQLGHYTNFMNLLDLSAVAVPGGFLPNGLPNGVTLFADHHCDLRLLSYAQALQEAMQLPFGALGRRASTKSLSTRREGDHVDVVVCGAHMQGLPLNGQLTSRGGKLIAATKTSENYRLYALPGGPPQRPALIRDAAHGSTIAVEVWRLPAAELGPFVAEIPAPLGIGRVELVDGRWLCGFLSEHYATCEATEITHLGGWRRYLTECAR